MATTPRGDDPFLRDAVLRGLARRIVVQRAKRAGAGHITGPVALSLKRRAISLSPTPLRPAQRIREGM